MGRKRDQDPAHHPLEGMKMPTSISDIIQDAAENFAAEVAELTGDRVERAHDEDGMTFVFMRLPAQDPYAPEPGCVRLQVPSDIYLAGGAQDRRDN